MRLRFMLTLVALVAPTVIAVPAVSAASAASVDPIATERSCIEAALGGGATPKAAADACLDSAKWDPAQPMTSSDRAVSCVQAPQQPYIFPIAPIINWGTLVICDQVIAVATFAGTLQLSPGTPVDAKVGPATPPPSALQFWSNVSVCPISGSYRSSILVGVVVSTSAEVTVLGTADSSFRSVNCLP
jgi:hypothetical protein